MQDLHDQLTIPPVHIKSLATAAAALGSTVVDTANHDSLEFHVSKSANTATTGTFIIDMESGSASATTNHTSATTSEVLGTNVTTLPATTANNLKLGYIGGDRFVSIKVTAGAATGAISIIAIQSNKRKQPTS